MLVELHIENFAIIDRLDIQFSPDLITFTGETGAGKSIIIDAVETLLGGRADANMIRSGADRASVEGVFVIPETGRASIQEILEREDLLDEPDYLILGREIRQNGRNVARVNGRSVGANLLRELGEFLIDVHGQSEHLSLLRVNQHLGMLDAYAAADREDSLGNVQTILNNYRQIYRQLQAVQKDLDELRRAERDSARRIDMLTYQINEIDTARLHIGEEEELKGERNRLANAESLASLAQEALAVLDEAGSAEAPSASDLLGQAARALAGLARLDPAQAALSEQGETILDSLADLIGSLHSYLEGIEFNPKRLDLVEERITLLHTLRRKYGDSIEAILAYAEDARLQLDAVTNAGERILELEAESERLRQRLGQEGSVLSQKRHAAARKLAEAIEQELVDLHMAGARFTVQFEQHPDPEGIPLEDGQRVSFDANGLERVEFLIAPNPGEGFKPLAKIASGGETSRLMLALKNVLAKADRIPTLIFDEIDQGIGGRVGTVVGQKLWSLARGHQVLCITHLPQLAAFGEQHFQVKKQVHSGRTTTLVLPLEGQERIVELAQMFGEVSEGTLRSARDLIQAARKQRSGAKLSS